MRRLTTIFAVLAATLLAAGPGAAQGSTVETGLSSHRISITSSFTGTELLLFGTVEAGGDIMVLVRGPETDVAVRRKERVGGIWVNRNPLRFLHVPSYYAVAANRPLDEIAPDYVLEQLQAGIQHLHFEAVGAKPGIDVADYREAILRTRRDNGLFREDDDAVNFIGKKLFHTRLEFPANVAVGSYLVQVYLIERGEIVGAQSSPVFIAKTGVERAIFDLAHQQPALYGLAAILIALFAGWLAAAVFRKT